ncbi:hypothetical protein [Sorangium sp. So ce1078]|uniref:hypothetical protein n=1 Tax=Sorangium sp. So ce1078 TaxID=3133329 RepID=UPI003F5E40BF
MRSRKSTVPVLLGLLTCAAAPLSCGSGGAPAPSAPASSSPAPRPPGAIDVAEPPSPEGSLYKVIDLQVTTADLWHLKGGAILLESDRDLFALIQGDAVQVLPAMGRGLPPEDGTDDRGSVQMITGRWPDNVWLVWRDYDTSSAADNLWYERLFRYRGDHWERIHETKHDQSSNTLYRGLWEQPEGCLVGLLADDRSENNAWQAQTEALDCARRPSPTLSFKAAKQTEYGIAAALGFASGHVAVLEQHTKMREGEPKPPRLVLSQPGPPNRTEIALPLPPEIAHDRRSFKLLDCKLLGGGPSELYLVGNYDLGALTMPLLLRFDGTSFAPLPSSPVSYIGDADLAEDGSLVLLGSPPKDNPKARSIWILPRGGAWRERPMPVDRQVGEPYRPWSIAARSNDDVWVVGYHENNERKNRRLALFHSRRPAPAGHGGGAAVP